MNDFPWKIAYITAGAGGMYCGSCMHDNTLARALSRQGVDVHLVPTYTPIRTDEEDVSVDRVFYGGINVLLQQRYPLFRHLPDWLDRLLAHPWLIRQVATRAAGTNAGQLGALTVSMLRGRAGFQSKEARRLCTWLAGSMKPDLIDLTNILIAGFLPELKARLQVPVLVTLQGDDIFLDELTEPFKSQAFGEIRRLVQDVDAFLVYSQYYADFMHDYFSIPRAKFRIVPLGLDTGDFVERDGHAAQQHTPRPPTVGYLARLAPEKGLHLLVEAFLDLRRREQTKNARLHIAGWLGNNHRHYAEQQFQRLRSAGLGEHDEFHYAGSVDRQGKLRFLQGIDVLSVPTTYREPKGLFVLEALAAGVPVVQPEHGAFPELVRSLGGGRLVRPNDSGQLADALYELLVDTELRGKLGQQGKTQVHQNYNAEVMARQTMDVMRSFLDGRPRAAV